MELIIGHTQFFSAIAKQLAHQAPPVKGQPSDGQELAALLDEITQSGGLFTEVIRTLDLIALAEDILDCYAGNYPEKPEDPYEIGELFLPLQYGIDLFIPFPAFDSLFVSHCAELSQRVLDGEDTRLASAGERLAALFLVARFRPLTLAEEAIYLGDYQAYYLELAGESHPAMLEAAQALADLGVSQTQIDRTRRKLDDHLYQADRQTERAKVEERSEVYRPFTVHLASVGNPDFCQDPTRPLSPTIEKEAVDFAEAVAFCRAYIGEFNLGGGNWTGGQVYRGGHQVARISYNGRVWDMDDSEIVITEVPAWVLAQEAEDMA